MKKIISFILTFVMIFAMIPMSISAVGATTVVSLENGNNENIISAGAGKVAKVYLKISEAVPTCAAQITVNYDTALELVYVENGKMTINGAVEAQPYFNTMYQSAIYGADFGAQNGKYVFNATHNMADGNANVNKISGYFATLSFKVPDNSNVGDSFDISVSRENSLLISASNNGNANLDFSVSGAKIVVSEDSNVCVNHNFKETKVSDADYINNGFSYKECLACHTIQTEKTEALPINALACEGIAIRYAGNPTGLAATFTLNKDDITKIELDPKYKIEVGTISVCNEKEIKTVYYEEGKTENIKNDKIFAVLTDIASNDKAKFSAYITVRDTTTNAERTDYLNAKLAGSEEISIYDIVIRMDLRSYPSESSQRYLNTVINGF